MDELISVIVPIYKVEQFLKACLDSIMNQTYQNLEIILVDDGSPDNCGKICDEYALKDKRIKVIHKENGGLSSARNAGLDMATGQYISFVDSDDYIHESFLECLYQRIKQDNSDIALCGYASNQEELGKESKVLEDTIYSTEEVIEKMTNIEIHGHYVNAWDKLYKSRLFQQVRFPLGKINEDVFVTYLIYDMANKVSIVNKNLYFYRTSAPSIMRSAFSLKRFDAIEGYELERDYFKEKNKKLFYSVCALYGLILKDYYFNIDMSDIDNKEKYKKEMLKKGRNNLKYVIKSKKPFRVKIENVLFFWFPNFYYHILVKMMDRIKNLVSK